MKQLTSGWKLRDSSLLTALRVKSECFKFLSQCSATEAAQLANILLSNLSNKSIKWSYFASTTVASEQVTILQEGEHYTRYMRQIKSSEPK